MRTRLPGGGFQDALGPVACWRDSLREAIGRRDCSPRGGTWRRTGSLPVGAVEYPDLKCSHQLPEGQRKGLLFAWEILTVSDTREVGGGEGVQTFSEGMSSLAQSPSNGL